MEWQRAEVEFYPFRLATLAARQMETEPVVPSRHAVIVEASTLKWASRFGIVDRKSCLKLARIGCGNCAAYTYSKASLPILEMGAQLIAWLFLFDDRYGEEIDLARMAISFAHCEDILREGSLTSGAGAFERALYDLRCRFAQQASSDWLDRFADSMSRYFDGCLLEYPYRRAGCSPPLEMYRTLRCLSIGTLPVFDLVELAGEEELDPSVAERSDVNVLRDIAACLCAWVNDIYSHEKEQSDGDPLNLVSVIMQEKHVSVEEAFRQAVDIYNADMARLHQLNWDFEDNPTVSRYVKGIVEWVYGNHQWTETSYRYRRLPQAGENPFDLKQGVSF